MPITNQKLHSATFKKLKNLTNTEEINFNNTLMTAIMGPNGCGKSTIIHALACSFKPLEQPELNRDNYKFSTHFFLSTSDYNWSGSAFTLKISYRNERAVHNRVDVEYAKVDRWTPIYDRRPERHVEYIGISSCAPRIENESSISIVLFEREETDVDLKNWIVAKAGFVFNKAYTDYSKRLKTRKQYIGVRSGDIEYSSLAMGAGEQRVFFMLEKLYLSPKGTLFLVDEIDLLLHTDALNRLLEVIYERALSKDIQVIFTSHRESILDYRKDRLSIIHLYQSQNRTLYFDRTTPAAIQRLTGQVPRDISVYVEDDLSKFIIEKIASEFGIRRYLKVSLYGCASNSFTIAAALIMQNKNIENTLIVLDGDEYPNIEEKQRQIKSKLSGTEVDNPQKRESALGIIRQYNLQENEKPEQRISKLILSLNENDHETSEIQNTVRGIVNPRDTHDFVDQAIEQLGYGREPGLTKIIDKAAIADDWPEFTAQIREWMEDIAPRFRE
ncbi:AAA family ATPase [Serratia ureilytica]|uniref:AAA family ATPase n=1 Tax=Serratia ureilytica TaxID=300181 RepID=UPI00198143E9|nr:AAA family ATPase [Serratia ureilytica]MBN5267520.1 AAA family ATPase [Serratia ureilytica]